MTPSALRVQVTVKPGAVANCADRRSSTEVNSRAVTVARWAPSTSGSERPSRVSVCSGVSSTLGSEPGTSVRDVAARVTATTAGSSDGA